MGYKFQIKYDKFIDILDDILFTFAKYSPKQTYSFHDEFSKFKLCKKLSHLKQSCTSWKYDTTFQPCKTDVLRFNLKASSAVRSLMQRFLLFSCFLVKLMQVECKVIVVSQECIVRFVFTVFAIVKYRTTSLIYKVSAITD